MKNKIISMLLICFMCSQFILTAAAESDVQNQFTQNDEKVMDFISKMGFDKALLEENEELSADSKITRADFAVVLSAICGLGVKSGADKYFDEIFNEQDKNQEIITDDDVKTRFADIDKSYWAYDYIANVNNLGLMTGVSDKNFAPDKNITLNEAVTALMKALNYSTIAQAYGGYPTGYYQTAEKVKLLKNVEESGETELDWLSVQHLLYNALHTVVLKQTGYGLSSTYTDEDSQMLMTKIFDIDIVEGVISDNGISSLTGKGTAGNDCIIIDDTTLNLSENTEYIKKWLGHSASVYYYNEDSDNAYKAVYGYLSTKEKTVEFSIEDFEKITGSVISYFDGNKSKRANLVDIPYVIVNGEAVSEYDSALFDFSDGDIKLISWENGKFDVICVTKYDYCFVDRIDIKNEIIYNKIRTDKNDNLNVLNLKEYDFVTITDENGNVISVEDIKSNNVLNVMRGKNNIAVSVSDKKVSNFVVKSVFEKMDGKKAVSDGENEYKIINDYFDAAEKNEILLNKTYTLYLNDKNEVVWAGKASEEDDNPAVLTKTGMIDEDGEENYYIRVYAGNEYFDRLYLAEKVKVNNKRIEAKDAVSSLSAYAGTVILYKSNEEGRVVSVITAADYGDRSDRGLYRLNIPGEKLFYRDSTGGFYTIFFKKSSSIRYTIPENAEDYDDIEAFAYNKAGFSNNVGYNVEGYTTDPDSLSADYIVVRQKVSGSSVEHVGMVIEKVTVDLDSDDMQCYKIEGYGASRLNDTTVKRREFLVEDNVNFVDIKGNIITDKKVSDLEKGDVIRYAVNAKNKIDGIYLAYDYSEDKADIPEKNIDGYQTQWGYAYSFGSGIIRMSNRTEPDKLDFSKTETSQDNLFAYDTSGSKIVTVDTSSNKMKVSIGDTSDIIPYLSTKSTENCSKLVVLTEWDFGAYLIVVYNR